MARYIDAEMLRELIDLGLDIDFDEVPEIKRALLEMIDYQETVDVAPVVHAHKVRAHSQGGGTHWVICSNCGQPLDWQDAYCKRCGAQMDEEVPELSKVKLKPCPFCGVEPQVMLCSNNYKLEVIVECTNGECDIRSHTDYFPERHKELAISAWNTRAKMDEEVL